VLLSSTPDAPAPPGPLAADPDAAAVEPAVLAVQEVGVRDYRERLDALKRTDPFGDKFEAQTPAQEAAGSELAPADSGVPVASSAEPVAPVAPDPGPTASVGPGDGGAQPPVPGTDDERYVLVPRIDVEVGIVDRDRRQTIDRVKSGDLLPSKQTPVAMFLGNKDDSSVAEFLVSRDVSRVNGEGECNPGQNNCEFLRLKKGDSAYLRYDDDKRYVITVKAIYFARIPVSKAKTAE
jgi:hypothetical protein